MADKCPLAGAGKELVDLRKRDRIIEKAHGGLRPDTIRAIPVHVTR